MYDYPAQVLAVVDGDTIDIVRDAGADLSQHMRIRLNKINAPEMSTAEGKAAKVWLSELIAKSDGKIYIFTIKDKKEKYGRYLGEFWLWGEDPSKTPSINDRMVTSGHAKYQTY